MEDNQSNTTDTSEQNADDTASSTTTFKGFSPQRAIADAIATGWGQTAAEADYGHTDLPWDVDDDVASDTDMATQEKRKATAMHTDDDEVDPEFGGEITDRLSARGIDLASLDIARDSGVAGRADDAVDAGVEPERGHERVLAGTGSDDEDVHPASLMA